MMNTFAERLKFAISKRGISQAEAARNAGMSQQSINYIINNNLHSSKLAPQLAAGLDISTEWLIYGTGKFEESKVYELPILKSPYEVLKFINKDIINENGLSYTVIDTDLGDNAFAYLLEPNKIAICSTLDKFNSLQYLTLTTCSATITKEKGELSFTIFEWRQRHVDF
jgi:transcriptional regulator with XRE-family HTH domain